MAAITTNYGSGTRGTEVGGVSTSKSVSETVNGSHKFVVKGYSSAKGMGIGKYISSEVFSVGGYQWAVYFYPDGNNVEDNSAYVSVFIALASVGTDVRSLFELTLVDQSGKGRHKVHSHFGRALEDGPCTLKSRGSMWGYKRFYRRSNLEASDYLKDDCLVMNCTIGVVRNRMEMSTHISVFVPPLGLGQCMKELLTTGIGSDVVFQVGDEKFEAHKLILAARSPVFKAQFFGLVGDPNADKVVVEDIEPIVFKGILIFIYSDELPDIQELTGSVSMCTSTNVIQHMLVAADKYGLERLRLLCEAKLCEGMTSDTVATTLALADLHQCAGLKSACLKFIAAPKNLRAVLQTEGFYYLMESCPSVLAELLEAVAVVHDHSHLVNRKRTSSTLGQNTTDSVDLDERRIRRQLIPYLELY